MPVLQFFMNSRACSTVAPVLEDLRITDLESYTNRRQPAARMKRFQINVDAGSARPGKVEA